MLQSAGLLVACLQRDEYRGRPAELYDALDGGLAGLGVPPAERALVRAAAALNGGLARRATLLLDSAPSEDPDLGVVQLSLRYAAVVMDRNWSPGGAGAQIDDADIDAMTPPAFENASPAAALVACIAIYALGSISSHRSLAGLSRNLGNAVGAQAALSSMQMLGEQFASQQLGAQAGYVALLHADVLARSGDLAQANTKLQAALGTYQGFGDPVGVGACMLLMGDWNACPTGSVELLGLDASRDTGGGLLFGSDPVAAAASYDRAEQGFQVAAADRGLAAVAIRRARLETELRAAGWQERARSQLEQCDRFARAAGDAAMVQLASAHRLLVDVELEGRTEGSEVTN